MRDSDVQHFFWGWDQIENISEITQPLIKLKQTNYLRILIFATFKQTAKMKKEKKGK